MANIYEGGQKVGTFAGTVLIQGKAEIGGYRKVFVSLTGPKAAPMYPPYGGILANPFKGEAKIYAGDLIEWSEGNGVKGAESKLLKTYEVSVATSGTEVVISTGSNAYGEIFRHIPFVGDTLMIAPATVDAKGTGVKVASVENVYANGKQTGWKVTFSGSIGTPQVGTILVEATKVGAEAEMVVKRVNAYAEIDYDMHYAPATGDEEFDKARYLFTPVLMYGTEYGRIERMSPIPACILAQNESKVAGWFKL